LILIKLPSDHIYHFIKTVRCFIGKNYNFLVNKFIEGKWGFSLHKKKKINVRGVAMNPVDHPNGGRTKAKQPEKSPWG
jgi:large subunit ribosomal protein L2